MRSEKWFRERPLRAERRIQEAQRAHHFQPGVLLDALQEFTDDAPTEEHARELAHVLGCLRPDEYRHFLREALEALRYEAGHSVWRAEQKLGERLADAGAEGQVVDPYSKTLAEIRGETPGEWNAIYRLALILQALTWAIAPPGEYRAAIVY